MSIIICQGCNRWIDTDDDPDAIISCGRKDTILCAACRGGERIIVSHVMPPIPTKQFDYSAVTDNYEPPAPIGYGATPREAIDDLLEQLEDR